MSHERGSGSLGNEGRHGMAGPLGVVVLHKWTFHSRHAFISETTFIWYAACPKDLNKNSAFLPLYMLSS